MVLSPIEPVAPSTLTLRTADVAARLFRKGTALICSPNHKTAADAIDAAPHHTDQRGTDHRKHQAIEPIQQTAVAGNDMAGILHPETPLHRRLEKIAEVRKDGQFRGQKKQRQQPADAEPCECCGHSEAEYQAADGARPRLLRADA